METGLLHLHNILRWAIVLLLLVTFFQALAKKPGMQKTSLFLMISAHLTLVLGLYQWIAGRYGLIKGLPEGVELMKDSFYRFYWIEHPVAMLVAIVLITVARKRAKTLAYGKVTMLLLLALVLIAAAVPWPFRVESVARPLFPGM